MQKHFKLQISLKIEIIFFILMNILILIWLCNLPHNMYLFKNNVRSLKVNYSLFYFCEFGWFWISKLLPIALSWTLILMAIDGANNAVHRNLNIFGYTSFITSSSVVFAFVMNFLKILCLQIYTSWLENENVEIGKKLALALEYNSIYYSKSMTEVGYVVLSVWAALLLCHKWRLDFKWYQLLEFFLGLFWVFIIPFTWFY